MTPIIDADGQTGDSGTAELLLAPTVERGTMREPGTGDRQTRISRFSAGRDAELDRQAA